MPLKREVIAFEEQVEVLASMDVGKLWDRYLGEFLAEWERLNRQKLEESEMAKALQAFIDGLSERPVEDVARTSSSVAYSQGRSVSILESAKKGEIKYVVRSEILDRNTCDMCRDLDGAVIEADTPEYYNYMPPAYCVGGDRCRGFYIAVRG